jgi:hypothetical protein
MDSTNKLEFTESDIKKLIDEAVKVQMAAGLKSGFESFREYFQDEMKTTLDKVTSIEEYLSSPDNVSTDTATATATATDTDTATPYNPTGDAVAAAEDMASKSDNEVVKALQERLAQMEKRDAEREEAAKAGRFKDSLRSAISPENPLHSSVVEELLSNRLKGLIESDGAFISTKGETMTELVQQFFQSPEGSHFKPAKGKTTATQPTDSYQPSKEPSVAKQAPSLDDMLKDMVF